MQNKTWGLILMIFFMIFALLFINSSSSEAQTTSNRTIIYLDVSGSMAGFMQTDDGILPVLLKRYLPELLRKQNYEELYICLVGGGRCIPQRVKNWSLHRWSQSAIYSQTDTNMGSVFNANEFKNYELAIFITDGVQDNQSNPNNYIGSDPAFFRDIEKMISMQNDAKRSAWLLGVKSSYVGTYYPAMLNQQGRRSTLHIAKDDKKQRQRPFYFWITSQNFERATKFSAALMQTIKNITNDQGKEVVIAPLTPLKAPVIKIEIDFPTRTSFIEKRNRWIMPPGKLQRDERVPLKIINEETPQIANLSLYVPVIKPKKNWVEVYSLNNDYVLIFERAKTPVSEIIEGCSDDSKFDIEIFPKLQNWLEEWSTDDDTNINNIEKTLFLNRLVPLVRNTVPIPLNNKVGLFVCRKN